MRRLMIAAALCAVGPVEAQERAPLTSGETLLEVQATGSAGAVPDVANFSTEVTSDGPTAAAALAANNVLANRVIAAARGQVGAARDAVRTDQLSVTPRYKPGRNGDDDDDNRQVIGYRATNRLSVRVTDLAGASKLVDALLAAGATGLSGPDFSFADEKPVTARARADAVRVAQREAADYASALDLRLGRVLRVSERSRSDNGASDIIVTAQRKSALAPIEPGERTVNVTVWIDYALVPK